MSTASEISVAEFAKINPRYGMVVDVRTPGEFREKRLAIPSALSPVGELNPQDFALRHGVTKDTPLYTFCASGNRAKKAAQLFADSGFSNVQVVSGGLAAWQGAGLPTVGTGGEKTANTSVTLDRQVRLITGLLTLLFSLLTYFCNIHFIFCVLFLACGQMYSGISNWCGLGLLLAKAPWNKGCSSGTCSIGQPKKNPGASCQ